MRQLPTLNFYIQYPKREIPPLELLLCFTWENLVTVIVHNGLYILFGIYLESPVHKAQEVVFDTILCGQGVVVYSNSVPVLVQVLC